MTHKFVLADFIELVAFDEPSHGEILTHLYPCDSPGGKKTYYGDRINTITIFEL